MIGATNECVDAVNGWACLALLDTGSQITSISKSFYKKHFTDCVMHAAESLLHVVGTAGQVVPFLGYGDWILSGCAQTMRTTKKCHLSYGLTL